MKNLLITFFVILAFPIFSQSIPSYVPTSGLVGWWPFNGNANDESGNGNNGTVNGAALTNDRNGNINSAYYFSGAGCATRIDANINTSSIQNGLTLSFWLLRSANGCISPRIMEFFNNGGAGELQIAFHGNSFVPGLDYYTSTTHIGSGTIGFNSVNNNEWNHFVFTNDGSFAKFYRNGVLINTIASSGNPILSGNAAFGRMNHPAYDALNGCLDDIGIWNRALTQAEISILYQTCDLIILSNPASQNINMGSNAQFSTSSNSPTTIIQWQSNCNDLGWQNIPSNASYMGATSNNLIVNNVKPTNNHQLFRAILTLSACVDTSNIAMLTIADTCVISQNPLPLILTEFSTTLTSENDILLSWITDINANFSHFIVERKTIDTDFMPIAYVSASTLSNNYLYKDRNCLVGDYFYRIKIFDVANNHFYTDILEERILSSIKKTIYPNPNNGYFTINTDTKNENIVVTIFDMLGNLKNLPFRIENDKIIIECLGISKGVYFISINDGLISNVEKIIIE